MSMKNNNSHSLDILIIDDEPVNLELLSSILIEAGYTVGLVNNGESALKNILEKLPLLIILDIRMPGMDGFEVCRRLKSDQRTISIPVIFLSGLTDESDKLDGFKAGGIDFIDKPFNIEEVLARVKTHLSLRRAQIELENANEELKWESTSNLIFSDLSTRLLSPYTLDEISNVVLECAILMTQSKFGFAGYIDQKTGHLYFPKFEKNNVEEESDADKKADFKKFTDLCGWVLENMQPLLTNSPLTDPRLSGTLIKSLPINRFLAAPAMVKNHLLGIIVIANSNNDYEEKQLKFLTMLTEKYAFAIEKVQTEEKLRKFSFALEQSPISIVITDLNGDIEYVNPKFTSLTGYTFGEVIHKNPRLLKSGEKSSEEYKNLWSTISSGKVWQGEFHNKKKSGDLFWEAASISPIRDSNGNITNFIAIKEDITEQKKLFESLQKSELQFRSVWDNSFSGMRLTNIDGIIVSVNKSFCNMVEKTKEELIGKPMSVIYEPDRHSHIIEKHKGCFSKKLVPSLTERTIKLWNGKVIWIELANSYLEMEGSEPLLLSIFRNITERKNAELALSQSQERLKASEIKYRQLVETAQEGIIRIDNSGIITYVNQRLAEMFGYKYDEVIGIPIFNLMNKRNASLLRSKIANRKNKISEQYEIDMTKKNGDPIFVSISASPITDDDGTLLGSIGIISDITEKKIIENTLIYERYLFDSLMDNSPDFIYFKDIDGKFIRVNKALAKWLGLKSPSEAVGKSDFDFFHEDVAKKFRSDEKKILATGQPIVNIDELAVFKDGSTGWTSSSKMPFKNKEGEIIGIFGTNRDISDRKFIEQILWSEKEELKITLRSVGDGVITTNKEGLIILINKKAEEITGWMQEEAFNKPVTEVLVMMENQKVQNFINPIKKIMNNRESDYLIDEATLITKENTDKIINYNVSSIMDKNNDYVGFVIVFRDITEQKRIESQVILSQKMESIGQLASGIAHEINTPMQYIGDNTRFLKDSFIEINEILGEFNEIEKMMNDDKDCTNSKEYFKNIIKKIDLDYLREEIPSAIEQSLSGIERVRNIVLAMKDFAHPGTKAKSFSDINHGIEVTSTISRNEWKYVAELELELKKDLPPVFCNLDEINQVILNMIVNSAHSIKDAIEAKSIEKGKIKIITESEGEYAIIKISDTGKGIPREIIERIYDPFFTTKEVGKGTGQGLAIAHDIIVNKHKGNIQVNSEINKGTTFTIRIPFSEPNSTQTDLIQEGK